MTDTRITVKLKPSTTKRLQKRMVYKDSYDAAINRLIDLADTLEGDAAKPGELNAKH